MNVSLAVKVRILYVPLVVKVPPVDVVMPGFGMTKELADDYGPVPEALMAAS